MLINSPNISGSLKVTGNTTVTGSLTVLGSITGTITGSATSASYVEFANVANKPMLVSGSTQISFNGIVDKPTLVSGSSQVSFNGIVDKPTLVSGSSQVTYSGLTGIPSGIISGSAQVTALGFASTGSSNTFQANQIITGSLFITQNLIVAGSSSIQYISSSVLDIADNIITVNAFNPGVRFGGLSVIDSGSSPQVSGSILFDSIKDQWIFVHQNQSVVTSSVVLMGPETYNDLGNETYLSANRLPKGSGIEHLRDSNITDTGTVVSVNSNTQVTGSLTVVGAGTFTPSTSSISPTLMLHQGTGGNSYGNIAGAGDSSHGIIMRGFPTNGDTSDYSVTTGDVMSFYEFGGEYRWYKKDGALTERMRITSNGNVLVGATAGRGGNTTGHLFKHPSGDVYFELMANSSTSENDILFSSGSTGAYGIVGYDHNTNSLRFFANSAERMRITSDGDLILGRSNYDPKFFMTSTGGNGINERFYIDGYAHGGGAGYGGGFRLYTRDTVNVFQQRLTIDSSGIATFSNQANFSGDIQLNSTFGTIKTSANNSALVLLANPSLVDNETRVELVGRTYPSVGNSIYYRANTHIFTGSNASLGELMRISSTRNASLGDELTLSSPAWVGGLALGKSGTDKVVAGFLASSTNGAVIGGHNSALNAWANINIAGTNIIFRTPEETERMRITSSGTLAIGTTDIPTLSTPNGGQLIVMPNAVIVSGLIALGSPYTQNIQIDVVYNNWGSNSVIGVVDMIIALREYAHTSGTAFGKIFATNSAQGATFASFNTTNITTSQCSITATSGGNYTLRITIDPSNVTDRGSFYLTIPNAGGTGSSISSITVSYV